VGQARGPILPRTALQFVLASVRRSRSASDSEVVGVRNFRSGDGDPGWPVTDRHGPGSGTERRRSRSGLTEWLLIYTTQVGDDSEVGELRAI